MKIRLLIIIGVIMMTTIPLATIAVLERYDNYLEQLEYEKQRIDNEPKPGERSYIEPELKAKLEKIELDLRDKVRLLHEDLPPSSYAVNLNHQTKEIEVLVENKQLISKIEDMITEYPDDITIVVTQGGIYTDLAFWSTDEDYCQEWCNQKELYELGCNQSILAHLTKHSNLFDEEFNSKYAIEDEGLPDGVSKEKFQECVDFIYEKRILMESERLSQVLLLCENTDAQPLGALSFENSTHHIDSQTCMWRLLDEN